MKKWVFNLLLFSSFLAVAQNKTERYILKCSR